MTRAERRRFILRGLLRAFILTVILVILYFLAPLAWLDGLPVAVVLVVAPLVLLAVSWWQIRAILRSTQPGLRGIEALAVIAPLYLLLFAAAYFQMAHADPSSFTAEGLTRLDTLYFTVTVFSTVGFGDISPASETARTRRHDPDDPEPGRPRRRRPAADGRRQAWSRGQDCGCRGLEPCGRRLSPGPSGDGRRSVREWCQSPTIAIPVVVAVAGDADLLDERVELGDVVGGEGDGGRAGVLVDALATAGAGDRAR